MAINLQGVDGSVFQDLLESGIDQFKTVITAFADKAPCTLAKLANPTKETFKDYRILVYAVKGACANICAEELWKKAYDLEMKAKGGDLDGKLAGNAPLLKEMEARAKNRVKTTVNINTFNWF